jgi:hypothetical protein
MAAAMFWLAWAKCGRPSLSLTILRFRSWAMARAPTVPTAFNLVLVLHVLLL